LKCLVLTFILSPASDFIQVFVPVSSSFYISRLLLSLPCRKTIGIYTLLFTRSSEGTRGAESPGAVIAMDWALRKLLWNLLNQGENSNV